MIRTAVLFLSIGPLICMSGRYIAPSPAKVYYPYKKIPTLAELIEDEGYKHDEFKVVTEDGFILSAHRFASGRKNVNQRGFPVLIINGFIFQSDGWLALGHSSLPFVLARQGYDVWLGEQRGSQRSSKHLKYSSNDPRMYNYTFHEQGVYDLPAITDFILNKTGYEQVLYVGYSLSAGMMIVLNSERPEYNKKFRGAVFIGPAGHLRQLDATSFSYSSAVKAMDSMIDSQIKTKNWVIFGNIDFVKKSLLACAKPFLRSSCESLIYSVYGVSDYMDPNLMFYQYATTVTTTSVFVGKHLLQVAKSGRFCKYDMGPEENEKMYGQETPPDYAFERTTVPVYLIYGGNDLMVTPDAARRTRDDLQNVVKTKFLQRFDHADFVFSKTAPYEVYESIVSFFDDLVNDTRS